MSYFLGPVAAESLEWWCSPAAYPLLGVSQVFRFDWFVLALQFAVVAGILLLLFLEWLERVRPCLME